MRGATLPVLAAMLLAPPLAWGDVEPGDVITPANHAKVKELVPEEIYGYAVQNFAGLKMTIVKSGDYTPHPKYVEATARYACQTRLDAKGNLVDYVAGQPFPYSEWAKKATGNKCNLSPDDPQFALKLAWNVNYRWQGSGHNYPHWGFSYMRNEGKKLWRLGQGEYRRTYFSHRADLLPKSHELKEGTDIEWAEFFEIMDPFDLRGTMYLLMRYTSGKEDDTWAYVPSLRRVRRVAATQKSDSLMGTEFTLEDFALFSGYVTAQDWEFSGERTLLAIMNTRRGCFPLNMGEDIPRRVTGMTRLGELKEWTSSCRYGPYGALPFIDERWEKRTMFQLDDYPKQKGHPYSLKKIWYDKETMAPKAAFAFDRAGESYKILVTVHQWSEDGVNPINRGVRAPVELANTVVNLQNMNSHVIQMFNGNLATFSVSDSLKYYDTTKLKRLAR